MSTCQLTPRISASFQRSSLTCHDKIDICRGLFAFLVVNAHCLDIALVLHPHAVDGLPGPVRTFLYHVLAAGIHWVIGFFVISGYCIQLSIERRLGDGSFSLGDYIAARLSRILPLYYLALVSALITESLIRLSRPSYWSNGLDASTAIAQVFVVQNIIQTYGCFAPSWSITNEMFYYLFYGAIVYFSLRSGVSPSTLGLCVCLGLTAVFGSLFFSRYHVGLLRTPALLFGLCVIWFLGVLVAEHRERLRGSRWAGDLSAAWPWVLALAILLWWSQRVHLQIVFPILGVAFALMLTRFLIVENRGDPQARPRWVDPLIKMLGLASYPTYLFHGPLVMLAASLVLRWGLFQHWWLTWIALTTLGIGGGILLGYIAERPIMKLRSKFLNRGGKRGLLRSDAEVRANEKAVKDAWRNPNEGLAQA